MRRVQIEINDKEEHFNRSEVIFKLKKKLCNFNFEAKKVLNLKMTLARSKLCLLLSLIFIIKCPSKKRFKRVEYRVRHFRNNPLSKYTEQCF